MRQTRRVAFLEAPPAHVSSRLRPPQHSSRQVTRRSSASGTTFARSVCERLHCRGRPVPRPHHANPTPHFARNRRAPSPSTPSPTCKSTRVLCVGRPCHPPPRAPAPRASPSRNADSVVRQMCVVRCTTSCGRTGALSVTRSLAKSPMRPSTTRASMSVKRTPCATSAVLYLRFATA
jgi:hypothetical protein